MKWLRFRKTLSLLLFLVLASPARAQESREPVPDADALKKAEKGLRGVYKKEFAKRKAKDRKALAVQLHALAKAETRDRAAQYVLYRNTQELYSMSGDWKPAWDVIGEMVNHVI